MYELGQMIKIDFRNLVKNPIWVIYSLAFPLLLVLVLSFLTKASYQGAIQSKDYYGITMLLFAALIASSFSANAFMEEKIKSANLRLIRGPQPLYFIPLSKIIATFGFTVLFYTIDGFLLWLVGVNFGRNVLAIWSLLILVDLFSVSIGVLFCTIFKSESLANQITSLVTQSLALLSGCFFPVYLLGKKIGSISEYSPITIILRKTFEIIYDANFTSYWLIQGMLLALSLICSLGSLMIFKGEDYL